MGAGGSRKSARRRGVKVPTHMGILSVGMGGWGKGKAGEVKYRPGQYARYVLP